MGDGTLGFDIAQYSDLAYVFHNVFYISKASGWGSPVGHRGYFQTPDCISACDSGGI